MNKKIINTPKAPAPVGPYNQAVMANDMLFISGQISIVPETGEMITHDISAETQQVMKNLSEILSEAGMNFENVVKTSIFLNDMGNFGAVNEIYASFFTNDPPARETVAVRGLPKDVNVEISCIAMR